MPKKKVFLSLVVMVMALALVGGATMAWFTDATEPLVNEFQAGTVEIDAGGKERFPNWNPGDDDEAKFCVTNTGSKKVNVRLNFEDAGWNPGPLRILVLYTLNADGAALQLIGVEWATFCQGCTGEEGYLATVTARYTYNSQALPSDHEEAGKLVLTTPTNSYFSVDFSNISANKTEGQERVQSEVLRWLSSEDNVNPFTGWCLDSATNINAGTFNNVRVYDPFCNDDWYQELVNESLPVKAQWNNIDFDKIAYVINHDFLSRGYNSTELQQAIWQYTNSSYLNRYYLGNAANINSFVDGIAANYSGDIVEALNDNNNVIWSMLSWEIKDEDGTQVASGSDSNDWVMDGDYIYFVNRDLEPGQTLCIYLKVKLDGTATSNIYQGVNYVFRGFFEAVQSSNYAPYYEWNVNHYGTP